MGKRNLLIVSVMVVVSAFFNEGVKAQDPEFTQFYANPLYLNPAFAGSSRCPRMVMNYRNQWPGINKTYITYSASYDQHVDALAGGFGVIVMNDQAGDGTINTTNASVIYSYYLPVTNTFSVKAGVQAAFAQKSVDWSKLTFGDMIDNKFGFTQLTSETNPNRSVTNVDFSAGLLGYSSSFFIGGFSDFIGPTAAAATTESLCFSTPLATSVGTVAVEVVVVNCSEDDPAESSSVFKEGSD